SSLISAAVRIVIRLSFDSDGICALLKSADYNHFVQLDASFGAGQKTHITVAQVSRGL
ncbi:MAG: hypothetical protein ACI9Y1_002407, partial [Lentisphaeria bacterium]